MKGDLHRPQHTCTHTCTHTVHTCSQKNVVTCKMCLKISCSLRSATSAGAEHVGLFGPDIEANWRQMSCYLQKRKFLHDMQWWGNLAVCVWVGSLSLQEVVYTWYECQILRLFTVQYNANDGYFIQEWTFPFVWFGSWRCCSVKQKIMCNTWRCFPQIWPHDDQRKKLKLIWTRIVSHFWM